MTNQTNNQKPVNEVQKDEITLKTKRQKPAEQIARTLKKISYLTVENTGKNVTARHVESLDRNKKPHQYWQTTFTPEEIQIQWTTQPNEHSTKRKIHVAKNAFQLLSLLDSIYPVKASELRILILDPIEQAYQTTDKTNAALTLENDVKERKINELDKTRKSLENALNLLNQQITTLSQENDQLKNRLTLFDRISDDTLKTKIVESIEKNPELNSQLLARQLSLPASRVEQALDELVKNGYLQPVN